MKFLDLEHDVACIFRPFTMCSGTLQLPLVTMSSNSHVSSYECKTKAIVSLLSLLKEINHFKDKKEL